MRVAIVTLGCKSNQYDSAALEDALKEASVEVAPFPGPADAYIINTCTVTGKTDCQSRQAIRKARRTNPGAVIIVTGCYAQVSPEEVKSLDGVDFIVGNPEKARIAGYLLKGRQAATVEDLGEWREGTPWSLRAGSSSGRTRANFKIQEGCSRACSYCIIPRARGLSRSLPLHQAERELDRLVANGYKEVVLTGIHLGAWGADLGLSTGLAPVLELIERKGYPCRFRVSSIDPDEVTDRMIDILRGAKRVCNHLHLPLQSGDNGIIRDMKRPYTRELFAEKVLKLVESVPGISIGADIIAGFPGEGEREFGETVSLLKDLPVSYLHIFPYSKRRGTAAASYPGQVDRRVIKERCERLREIDGVKREAFHSLFVGTRASVLVERARDKASGLLKGRTANYIQVFLDGDDRLGNELVDARLLAARPGGMTARPHP